MNAGLSWRTKQGHNRYINTNVCILYLSRKDQKMGTFVSKIRPSISYSFPWFNRSWENWLKSHMRGNLHVISVITPHRWKRKLRWTYINTCILIWKYLFKWKYWVLPIYRCIYPRMYFVRNFSCSYFISFDHNLVE